MSYLELEHQECSCLLREANLEFSSRLTSFCIENGIEFKVDELKPSKKKEHSIPKQFDTTEENKMYRDIVSKCHPDKTTDLPEDEKIEMMNMYHSSTEAKATNNFSKLFSNYILLGMTPEHLSESFLQKMEQEIFKLNLDLKNIKSKPAYQWSQCPEDQKVEIIKKFV